MAPYIILEITNLNPNPKPNPNPNPNPKPNPTPNPNPNPKPNLNLMFEIWQSFKHPPTHPQTPTQTPIKHPHYSRPLAGVEVAVRQSLPMAPISD